MNPLPQELLTQISRALECVSGEAGPRTVLVALHTMAGSLRRWEVETKLYGAPLTTTRRGPPREFPP